MRLAQLVAPLCALVSFLPMGIPSDSNTAGHTFDTRVSGTGTLPEKRLSSAISPVRSAPCLLPANRNRRKCRQQCKRRLFFVVG